ncbi:DUF6090 family protein [Hanstruepera flava]|uniref:DUF6090 family protein n=1 Tax=Hanstruepera flava TaxID=2930218 RepID=UPI0020279241|nr:DUF6090 family protein [Hanstruepera flava]
MIKFFRKIRQQLLSEGKTGKYLKYAIGEIILVVIGILIALQINNWNDVRKDRQRERIILKQLHSGFLENKRLFDYGIDLYKNKLEGCDKAISFFNLPENEQADSLSKRENLQKIFESYSYNPSSGLIESLLNSSSIEVIQSDSLKQLLVSWKDVLSDYREEEEQLNKDISDLGTFINKNLDFLAINNPENELNIATFNSVEFQNYVIKIRFSTNQLLNAVDEEEIYNHLEEIIRLSDVK